VLLKELLKLKSLNVQKIGSNKQSKFKFKWLTGHFQGAFAMVLQRSVVK